MGFTVQSITNYHLFWEVILAKIQVLPLHEYNPYKNLKNHTTWLEHSSISKLY